MIHVIVFYVLILNSLYVVKALVMEIIFSFSYINKGDGGNIVMNRNGLIATGSE